MNQTSFNLRTPQETKGFIVLEYRNIFKEVLLSKSNQEGMKSLSYLDVGQTKKEIDVYY